MTGEFLKERPAHETVIVNGPEERQQCYDVVRVQFPLFLQRVLAEQKNRPAIDEVYIQRIMVFHVEQKFPLECELDEKVHDDDPNTVHILLRLTPSLTPIGTIRSVKITKADSTYYKLSRLVVLKEYRKFSFGRALVEALHDCVRADALKGLPAECDPTSATATIACHSQIPAKGFYSRFGYVDEGPEFDEDGAPHQRMVLQLSLQP